MSNDELLVMKSSMYDDLVKKLGEIVQDAPLEKLRALVQEQLTNRGWRPRS